MTSTAPRLEKPWRTSRCEKWFVSPVIGDRPRARPEDRIKKEEIQTVENSETIRLGEQVVSLVRLADVLELPPRQEAPEASNGYLPVVLVTLEECSWRSWSMR